MKNLKKTKLTKVAAVIIAAMMLCGMFGTISYAEDGPLDNPLMEVSAWGMTISIYQYQILTIAYDDECWYKLNSRGEISTTPLYMTGKNPPEDLYAMANQYFGYIGSGQTEPETEYVEPTTEYVEPTTEYVEPETTTPYVEPTTEYVEPTTEYVEPTTEYVEPVTEYIPETEAYVEPDIEYVEPVHVHNWVDSVKKQYVWVKGDCTEARSYSPVFSYQWWFRCGCGNYEIMIQDEFGNEVEGAQDAFDEHSFPCGYNFWYIYIPIDIIGYKETIHTGHLFTGTWKLLDTMYCEDCDCYLVVETGEVLDELYTAYNSGVGFWE